MYVTHSPQSQHSPQSRCDFEPCKINRLSYLSDTFKSPRYDLITEYNAYMNRSNKKMHRMPLRTPRPNTREAEARIANAKEPSVLIVKGERAVEIDEVKLSQFNIEQCYKEARLREPWSEPRFNELISACNVMHDFQLAAYLVSAYNFYEKNQNILEPNVPSDNTPKSSPGHKGDTIELRAPLGNIKENRYHIRSNADTNRRANENQNVNQIPEYKMNYSDLKLRRFSFHNPNLRININVNEEIATKK